MKLTHQQIRRAVGDSFYQRGRAYFEQGKVLEHRALRAEYGYQLAATTAGSAGAVYQQDIAITTVDEDLDIDGECSCPVVYNCKHVAAACCAWVAATATAEDRSAHTEAAMTRWLDAFAGAGQVAGAPAEEFVIYVFDLAPPRGHEGREELRLEARLVKRRSKDGTPTRGRVLDVRDFGLAFSRIAHAISPLDRDIAELLTTGHDYFARLSIRGRRGYYAIKTLLESRRCHWANGANPPLAWGAPRTLHLTWERLKPHALLALRAEIDGGGLILPCEPPLYLDPLTHVIGPLDALGLNHAQLSMLESAPAVPLAQAHALAATVVMRFPGLPLPPPVPVPVRENTGQVPVPCLRLGGEALPAAPSPWLALEFHYDADRVPDWPAESVTAMHTHGGMVRVARDLNAEQAARARLAELGFVPSVQPASAGAARRIYVAEGTHEFETVSRWSQLLHAARAALENEGWEITVDESFPLRFETGEWRAEIGDDDRLDWFALSFHLQIGAARLPLIDLLQPILGADWAHLPDTISVPLGGQRYVDVPSARLRPLLEVLRDLFDRPLSGDGAAWRLSRMDVSLLPELEHQGFQLQGGRRWRELSARLRDFDGIRRVTPDPALAAELRPYQQRGLDWLQFLREYGFNGILADDMGLGKTVQALAHLLTEKRAGRLTAPALVVAPTSLMGNWRREAERFAPTLSVEVLHGQERHARFDRADTTDLLLTTYPLLPRDATRLREFEFHSVILDEAQTIKNPRAKAAQVVRGLQTKHRLCLTGTPLENHLGELWALFDFLMPGFLGDAETFRRLYRTPIETHGDVARQAALARRVAPFMLRRTKQAVAAELPPKTEIVQRIELGPTQAELYESIRVTVDRRVRAAIARHGLARSHITVLDALLKLRQVCCDPRLLTLEGKAVTEQSAKLEVLLALLDELLAEGRKVLVFSQFTSMLELIEQALDARGIRFTKLTGKTRRRDDAVDRFRRGEVDLFLISLKAGGVGLNLPEADTVIHYDPWWNPAVEIQATDRAHRIGQTQPVFVYKLIVENSVEEKMLELQARKRALAAGIYVGQAGDEGPLFDTEMIAQLFEPLGPEN